MASIINWVSGVVIVILVLGALIGFFRGWVKSLSRFICLLVSFIIALFVSPVISSSLIKRFSNGTSFSIFGFTLDFQDVLSSVSGDSGIVSDLMSIESTTNSVAFALMNIAINLVTFVLLFLIASVLSYIVYFIISLILTRKKKKMGDVTEKTKSYWWLKVLGAGIGFVSSMVVCLVIMTPLFGAMNVCDKFLTQSSETQSQTASAVSSQNLICGELYYKEDSQIGKVETYLEKYSNFRDSYNKSVMGSIFKYTGVRALGSASFSYLTKVNQGGLVVNFTDEFVAIAKTYNVYKETFIVGTFDITNNESVDNLITLYNEAKQSEIVRSYLVEFFPNFYTKWSNNDSYLSVKCPVEGDFKPIFMTTIKVFNTPNFKQIDENLVSVLNVVKIANNNNVIKRTRANENLIEILPDTNGFIENSIVQLSSTLSMRRTLPEILNDTIVLVYDQMIGDGKEIEKQNLTNAEIDLINWKTEGKILEDAIIEILKVYRNTQGKSSDEIIDELKNIGFAIDRARESMVISKPMKDLMLGFIQNKLDISASVKETLIDNINTYWDIHSNPQNANFKFKDMFEAIETTAKIAEGINSSDGSVNVSDLQGALEVIIENEGLQNAVTDALAENIVGQFVEDEDDAEILSNMLGSFVNNIESKEDIPEELEAGQTVVDLMQNAKENDNQIVLTEGNEEQESKEIVESLIKSNAVMGMIKESDENSALYNLTTNLEGDVSYIESEINNYETNGDSELEENKKALQKLFGINS